jgi:hypothetical protein
MTHVGSVCQGRCDFFEGVLLRTFTLSLHRTAPTRLGPIDVWNRHKLR